MEVQGQTMSQREEPVMTDIAMIAVLNDGDAS